MKLLIVALSAGLLVLIIQGIFSLSIAQVEKQKYSVLFRENKFEIRKYAPAVLASVKMDYTTYDESATPGFRILAGYIFGKNSGQQKIAMTSPVMMKMGSDGTTMSFVMPGEYSLETLPDPSNGMIEVHESPDQTIASLKFSGYANDRVINKKIEELQTILGEKGIRYSGDFTFLGYNSPFQFIGRRNEVIVSVPGYSNL